MIATEVSRCPDWSAGLSRPARRAAPRIGLVERLWTRFRAWRAQRETLRLLYSVDSATLRELGISPREIESLVYGDSSDRLRGYDANWWRT